MTIIGITGGSGSGKSYVAHIMEERGGKWIDADAVYHKLLSDCGAMRREILAKFPEANMNDGEINRKKLASMVFTNDKDLMELNAITHPFIISEIENIIGEFYRTDAEFAIVDAIALFESGLSKICDATIGVIAGEKCRLERIMLRDDIGIDRARARIRAQQHEDYYRKKCDYIIENDSENSVEEQIEQILNAILN